jgi:hypothetical protein
MKFKKIALLPLLFGFFAGGCSTDSSTSSGDAAYGDVRYQRTVNDPDFPGACHVYATDSRVTMVFKQDFGKMGNISILSQAEFGAKTSFRDEVVTTGRMFEATVEYQCEEISAMYNQLGGTVNCTDSEVKAHGEVAGIDLSERSARMESAIATMKEYCDMYVEEREDDDGGDIVSPDGDHAVSCTVHQDGASVVMNVVFEDKTAMFTTTVMDGYTFATESYTGVDAETLAQVCGAYRLEEGLYDVTCDANTIMYKSNEIYPVEEEVSLLESMMCPAFLNGSYTLEDAWFEK